jgi:outer membrane biosynthesis protein TonB
MNPPAPPKSEPVSVTQARVNSLHEIQTNPMGPQPDLGQNQSRGEANNPPKLAETGNLDKNEVSRQVTQIGEIPVASKVKLEPQKMEVQKIKPTVVVSRSSSVSKWGIKKKATFAKKSEISDLKSYLKPSSGQSVQVIVAWYERVLNTINFGRSKTAVLVGPSNHSDFSLPGDLSKRQFPLFKRLGEEVDVLIPGGTTPLLITSSSQFDLNDLKKLNRLQPAQAGNILRLQNNEILNIKFDNSPIELFVRRIPETLPIRPLGFIDLSSGELTGLIVSMVIVALVALYMVVYAPVPEEVLNTEEVRLAQFIYTKPPTPPGKVEAEPKKETPPPPPPKEEPKKIKVTEEKIEKKPEMTNTVTQKLPQTSGGQSTDLRPSPSKVVKPIKQTSVKQGGAVKLSETEGANAQSQEKDVSQTGLLSAFGGGGIRSKLDKAYSGSGELLGAASQASGFSGQNKDRSGEDLGSRFKDDGAGGKGIATQGIAGLGTKGRGSGNAGYGAVGDGDGKGRVTIDVPGTNAEFVGTIDREAVRRVIRSILSQIRACYEKQLRLNPTLSGKVVITFEIAEQGRVTSAVPKSSSLPDPEVGRCVAARIKSQRFPEPPAGTIAVVDYPFVFDSQK